MKKAKKPANPYILVILSFLIIIAIGSVLLTLPFTQISGEYGSYIDALVTAVSATCVTGISTYPLGVANTLTFWGQLIVIIMVQIGGLGFITILTCIITMFSKKIQFKNRYLIAEMVNSTSVNDVVAFVRKIILITLSIEIIGTLCGLPVFLTMYQGDIGRAIWYSIFHSISSFNNAGFDLFCGTSSLIGGLQDPLNPEIVITGPLYIYFCIYIMVLIILGGFSFAAIIDIVLSKKRPKQYFTFTKICLVMTFTLLIGGSVVLFLTDGLKSENPMNVLDCIFQSVSCRTAGFMTYSQDQLSVPGKIICAILMFIGGNPLSTAGGLKTTTLFVIVVAINCYLVGSKVHAFKKEFSSTMIIKSMAVVFASILVAILGFISFNIFGVIDGCPAKTPIALAFFYEVFSAYGTVGFFTEIEPYFTLGSKITLCVLMFIGRLGPMTFMQIFQVSPEQSSDSHFEYIKEDFLVG